MPSSMLHLIVAKNVNPNANIAFYIGNLAVDAIKGSRAKANAHFENILDMEGTLKELALTASDDYSKGILLHLYVDWKWKTVYMTDFAKKMGEAWFLQYREEIGKITAYAFHNTYWAHDLYEQLERWDYDGFVETEFIKKENVKDYIRSSRKWHMENKLEPSTVFPPELIEIFAGNTAMDFSKWLTDLKVNP